MRRVKRRIYAGAVCEIESYCVRDSSVPIKDCTPRLRFQSEEERAAHRDGIARRRFVAMVNANFDETAFYLTLTFDPRHEVYSMEEARAVRKIYVRRIRRRFPEAVICTVEGEGATNSRFHIHMIARRPVDEIEDPEAQERAIEEFKRHLVECWDFGQVKECERLWQTWMADGVDLGRDYVKLATYLFDHWKPSFGAGSHRYYFSRNAKKVDRETVRECREVYSAANPPEAPKAPEGYRYFLRQVLTTQYGYQRFKYVMIRVAGPDGEPLREVVPPPVEYITGKHQMDIYRAGQVEKKRRRTAGNFQ